MLKETLRFLELEVERRVERVILEATDDVGGAFHLGGVVVVVDVVELAGGMLMLLGGGHFSWEREGL